jgi:hypothetical protein
MKQKWHPFGSIVLVRQHRRLVTFFFAPLKNLFRPEATIENGSSPPPPGCVPHVHLHSLNFFLLEVPRKGPRTGGGFRFLSHDVRPPLYERPSRDCLTHRLGPQTRTTKRRRSRDPQESRQANGKPGRLMKAGNRAALGPVGADKPPGAKRPPPFSFT